MVHRRDAHDDGWADLGFARVDVDRAPRTGDAEVVYAAGKTPQQTVELLRTLREHHPDHPALATRARGFVFEDGLLRRNEIFLAVGGQLQHEALRPAVRRWVGAGGWMR